MMKDIFGFSKREWKNKQEGGTDIGGDGGGIWNKIGKDRLAICILGGLLLFVVALPIDKKENKTEKDAGTFQEEQKELESENSASLNQRAGQAELEENTEEYGALLSKEVEDILKYMEGVGRVKVLVTMETSKEAIVEKDSSYTRSNTLETDSEGGSRNISDMDNQEETIYGTDSQGNKTPYVVKEIAPLVKGVVVVAEGGGNSQVKENITEALVALFDLEPHKIKVVKMRGDLK
ncbi:MAG: stage III sporulation protein AG [Roseburia sp.]|nr:stage III sporulation protein AG [Roseburia sp.]MCM1278454.1 stage III sporulation protein AG [Robinsoniella sp.]